MTAHPTRTPFTKSKKSRRGKLQKNMQRVFWSGRVRPTADRRRGSELAFCVKMGSSEFKKSLHEFIISLVEKVYVAALLAVLKGAIHWV